MGVTGLWQILQPSARPIKIEALNRKRLAVDASIWIYQFLKAVRDKEGNALRNSHVVGFFRRICKLLFFGIKPVFVFDGGAPALKRQTVAARKRRREGRREDAVRTAGKLLAVQMQRRAEEEEEKRKEDTSGRRRREVEEEEEAVPEEGLVYVDELQMSAAERQQNRKFRKKDAYHLPDMQAGSMHEMGGPNDPRVMSLEDLQTYARQFESEEDINVYDFSKIDYESPFFTSLPASDRYNILNAARLRSRLRMGHSKEQLDSMFPDRMAFSRFQIARVSERNELTTRLMNINDGDVEYKGGSVRVAGEKAREYVLVRNDGVEGGWALGVITGDEGSKRESAIDLEKTSGGVKEESSDQEEEDGFEDVPIEGLNRLPKRRKLDGDAEAGGAVARQRRAVRGGGQAGAGRKSRPGPAQPEDPESLFVAVEPENDDVEEDWEEVEGNGELFGEDGAAAEDDDEQLRQAIAMSLQQNTDTDQPIPQEQPPSEAEEDWYEVFHQRAAEEAKPVPKGSARAIANILNKRAHGIAPDSHETTSFGVPVPKPDDEPGSGEDDGVDLQAALAESRRGKRKVTPPPRRQVGKLAIGTPRGGNANAAAVASPAKPGGFSGPLPFEKLDLGTSLLGKKKMQQRTEEVEGGFEKANPADKEAKKGEPLPPWFIGDLEEGIEKQERLERADRERAKAFGRQFRFQGRDEVLGRREKGEVIDLDGEDEGSVLGKEKDGQREVIELDDDDDDSDEGVRLVAPELTGVPVDNEIRMGDLADAVRAEPPVPESDDHRDRTNKASEVPTKRSAPFEVIESDGEEEGVPEVERQDVHMREAAREERQTGPAVRRTQVGPFAEDESDDDAAPVFPQAEKLNEGPAQSIREAQANGADDEEELDWSESEDGRNNNPAGGHVRTDARPVGGEFVAKRASRSLSVEFEDVPDKQPSPETNGKGRSTALPSPDVDDTEALNEALSSLGSPPGLPDDDDDGPLPAPDLAHQASIPEDIPDLDDFDDFDDPEEEALLKALTLEAEEHARFASTLNRKTPQQNIAEYESELKQLRNQQKKDRRDADEVTHIMITECQQLLRLFGLPYITAPMEAEAQCAELVRLGLVDGIVTDDSDCFLFGGTRVYKNMFNQAKFVECYLASDLEREFGLTRGKLISVAELLGSDYTEGLAGVGPVTALEILGEFGGSLVGFREWWTGVQMNTITKEDDKSNTFRKKFRRNAAKIFLPPGFPDPRIASAYWEPEVDSDPAGFQWGVPDLDALRGFLMATIGWSAERTDEVLVPVIRDMNRRADEGTQANITAFFDGGVGVGAAGAGGRGEGFAPRKRGEGSRRMGDALGRMAERAKVQRTLGEGDGGRGKRVDMRAVEDVVDEDGEAEALGSTNGSRKRKGKKRPAVASEDSKEDGSDFEQRKKKGRKKGRKKAI
ncbi:DNA repair protein rad2 [Friedmanniomyces endolithicus]|uniref:DNA repair protein rad2 n=1 Tax=Friedmanniomyces endolithicus TaxID=329885 RepID=A0AAN6HB46_9PEZI|nr:DNA repair protein rad2 [Friedmanniomyces endolithicus]KAK0812621.1 DNA repair protein rad2 [Friedmanniomyces endolithicus]KAK0860071.1 DNA repair protein rad2 [Friedmanniomyces endolithicus]KAK0904623.1 DNA repair protein rad2 [Friedmanniomyces endolithicus]KAK0921189.1 DNA repair protein rad2 [Friedmanniomyces endolithicus]